MDVKNTFSNKQILSEEIPPVDNLQFQSLNKDFIYILLCEIILSWVLLIAVLWIVYFVAEEQQSYLIRYFIATLILILFLVLNLLIIRKAYSTRGFAIRQHDVSYRRGVIISKLSTIPFCKIQEVTIKQGIIARMFKLYTLQIDNGSQGAEAMSIPGLMHEEAEKLREYILKKIEVYAD